MAKEDILIEEDLEITAATAGAAPVILPTRVISIFPALAHRNFQLYFMGQAISLIGFWLQQVGTGYYVFQITHSAFWVGASAAIGGLPFLIFTTFAGVAVDRVNKQKVLILTQAAEAVVDIALGILILTSRANLPLVVIAMFLIGCINSIDLPTRLTFLVEMVGKKDLASAIPINNGLFNAARFVGPALAGILIAFTSVGWTFILNGFSFIAGIWAILAIKPIYKYQAEVDVHPLESLKTGIKYSFTHPKILYFIILAFFSAIFIWPFQTLMPVVSEKVFHTGAHGLGTLLSAAGAGSLTGAIFTSANSARKNKIPLILIGIVISSVSLILFSLNQNFTLAHVILFLAGFGTLMQVSTLNTLVQLNSPDNMRARVMAVYLTMFVGVMPLGNILAGTLAQKTSALFTIGLSAALMLLVGAAFYFKGIFKNLAITN